MKQAKYDPEISIIIPAKDEEANIAFCLESIKAQGHSNRQLEILVVDNGSKDKTAQISEEYGAWVLKKVDGSIAALRNFGAAHSNGRILLFLDADIILPPTWLEIAADILLTRSDVIAVGGLERWAGENETWVERGWQAILNGKGKGVIEETAWISSQAMAIKREDFFMHGGFNEELVTCEDVDLSLRLSSTGKKNVILRSPPYQHLRTSKTLGELFRRERWRGTGNIRGLLSHGINANELPSILGPLIFGLSLLTFLILLLFGTLFSSSIRLNFLCVSAALIAVTMPFLMLMKKTSLPRDLKTLFQLYVVSFTYLSARFTALLTPGKRK